MQLQQKARSQTWTALALRRNLRPRNRRRPAKRGSSCQSSCGRRQCVAQTQAQLRLHVSDTSHESGRQPANQILDLKTFGPNVLMT